MGCVLNTLEARIEKIAEDPQKLLDEKFIMNIFKEYIDELPPFKKYWDETFKKKQMAAIACKSGTLPRLCMFLTAKAFLLSQALNRC